ncbi:MAG TPA: hypothetical protein VMU84_16655 [Thermoanaerobaculia bacterium]|nr:hypothetical protein [Thermoanaerobaculia bacterium]
MGSVDARMRMTTWRWVGIGAALGALAFGITQYVAPSKPLIEARPIPRAHIVAPPPAAVPEPPPAAPSSETPTLVEESQEMIDRRVFALASELGTMWTRNPDQLVCVIDDAARSTPSSPSVTLLLAIAHAETNGKILDVSEAGAVGLAQTTPIAYRQEGFDGKVFVTNDYLIGARAYIVKKPLGDADTIASMVVDRDDAKTRKKAKRLLRAAKELRREGIDELDLLEPYASAKYFTNIRRADRHNREVLEELDGLLAKGSRAQLRVFRNRVRNEYRALKSSQLAAWKRYQVELAKKRDRMLEKQFGMNATQVKKTMAYEASEYLGEHLDERFSAKKMASFLALHLERKTEEARKLAASEADVEAMTAALYNGGSHNVKRMLAGLIRHLPETEQYMKKVPATRRRLDGVITGDLGVRTLR